MCIRDSSYYTLIKQYVENIIFAVIIVVSIFNLSFLPIYLLQLTRRYGQMIKA